MPGSDDLPIPRKATPGSAGLDLRACISGTRSLEPGERAQIPTGFALALPAGYEGQVRPRSGLALRQGLTLLNSPGTIDSDYRGEIAVIVINLGREPVVINRGDRVAQLVVAPITTTRLTETDALPPTSRSDGGFGHTGRD